MEFLVIWLICAVAAAAIASSKGRSGFGWFILGCISGIFAVIVVACLPSRMERVIRAGIARGNPSDMKKCPECAELIRLEARKCKHCGSAVPTPDTHVLCPDCKGYVAKTADTCPGCGCKMTPRTGAQEAAHA